LLGDDSGSARDLRSMRSSAARSFGCMRTPTNVPMPIGGGPTPARLRARKAGYEKSQMITVASGRPIPNDQPMTIASAKSKPTPARNAGNDMPLLL